MHMFMYVYVHTHTHTHTHTRARARWRIIPRINHILSITKSRKVPCVLGNHIFQIWKHSWSLSFISIEACDCTNYLTTNVRRERAWPGVRICLCDRGVGGRGEVLGSAWYALLEFSKRLPNITWREQHMALLKDTGEILLSTNTNQKHAWQEWILRIFI